MNTLFKYLQHIVLTSTMALRAIISLPLAFAAVHHFGFLKIEAGWLMYAVAYISIFAIEAVLTLFSLLTAYFRAEKLQRAYFISVSFVVLFFLLNAFLLWEIRSIYTGATIVSTIVFQVLNLASVVLAESIGFMRDERDLVPAKEEFEKIPDIIIQARDNDNLTKMERVKIVYAEKFFRNNNQIAQFLGVDKSTVSRAVAEFNTCATN